MPPTSDDMHDSPAGNDDERPDLPPEPEPAANAVLGLGRVGALLGVSRQRVQRFLADGLLQGVKVGRQVQVVWSDASKAVRGAIDRARGQGADADDSDRSPMRMALDEVLAAFETDVPDPSHLLNRPLGTAVSASLGLPALFTHEPDPKDGPDGDELSGVAAALDAESDDALALRTVLALLRGAISCGATELHIEPGRHGVWIRQRRAGVRGLELLFDATTDIAIELQAAAHRVLQLQRGATESDSATVDVEADGRAYLLRSVAFPSLHGPAITVRLQAARDRIARSLDDLELWPPQVHAIRALLTVGSRLGGLLVISGDDATATDAMRYSLLRELASPDRKIVSLEYPVEADLDGVTQVVLPAAHPATALRELAAHSPHVVACSAVPDHDTAHQLISLAGNGALVVAVLDAVDAAAVPALLIAQGISADRVSAVLRGVVGVCHLRRLREHAGEADPTADEHRAAFGMEADDVPLSARRLPDSADATASFSHLPLLVADVLPVPSSSSGATSESRLRPSLVHHLRHGRITLADALHELERHPLR